jgi:hypothetical protein
MGAVFSERVRYLYHLYAEQEKSDRRLLSENKKLYSRNMLQRKCKFLLRPLPYLIPRFTKCQEPMSGADYFFWYRCKLLSYLDIMH